MASAIDFISGFRHWACAVSTPSDLRPLGIPPLGLRPRRGPSGELGQARSRDRTGRYEVDRERLRCPGPNQIPAERARACSEGADRQSDSKCLPSSNRQVVSRRWHVRTGTHLALWAPAHRLPGYARVANRVGGRGGPPRPIDCPGERRIRKHQVQPTSGCGAIPNVENGVWRDQYDDPRAPDTSPEGRRNHWGPHEMNIHPSLPEKEI